MVATGSHFSQHLAHLDGFSVEVVLTVIPPPEKRTAASAAATVSSLALPEGE
jgi:hypothetical protein